MVEANAVSEALKDILKQLVSSTSPSVFLSTKSVDIRDVQVGGSWGPGPPPQEDLQVSSTPWQGEIEPMLAGP